MTRSRWWIWLIVAALSAAVAAAFFIKTNPREDPEHPGSGSSGPASNGSASQPWPSPMAKGNITKRSATDPGNTEDPDGADTADGPRIKGPRIVYKPGSGVLAPFDVTNIADPSFGLGRFIQFTHDPGEWDHWWRLLHYADRGTTEADSPDPPPFDPAEEGLLLIGVGERPRMDYAITLEPVNPKYGEMRYRFAVSTLPTPPVEVRTRPARVWLVPLRAIPEAGLVIEDEQGFELAKFDKPQPVVDDDPGEDDDPDDNR